MTTEDTKLWLEEVRARYEATHMPPRGKGVGAFSMLQPEFEAMLRALEAVEVVINEATADLVTAAAILARVQYDEDVPDHTGEAMRALALSVKGNVDRLRKAIAEAREV